MKITVSQLRRIIKEEVNRTLSEAAMMFKPGDMVRPVHKRYGTPLYGSKPDGSIDVTAKIDKLPSSEDAEVIKIDSGAALIRKSDGGEFWVVTPEVMLVPAAGPARPMPTDKEFFVTFIGHRGARDKIITAKNYSAAQAMAKKMAKPDEDVEVSEV